LETEVIYLKTDNVLSKMTLRLRAEDAGEIITLSGGEIVGRFSLSSCLGRPVTSNSVLEGLRDRQFDVIQL
jgi:hypothetical protein